MIKEGIVLSHVDPLGTGSIIVALDNLSVTCKYVSPFGGYGFGLVGLPEPGTRILVLKTETSYYYFGTIFTPKEGVKGTLEDDSESSFSSDLPKFEDIYKWDMRPGAMVIQDPKGNHVILSYKEALTEKGPQQDLGIKIKTVGGKYIHLEDSLEREGITIADDKGNYCKINTDEESLECSIRNDISILSKEGSIYIEVEDKSEGDIHLTNHGRGKIKILALGDNVEIESVADVNIKATNIKVEATERIAITGNIISLVGQSQILLSAPEISLQSLTQNLLFSGSQTVLDTGAVTWASPLITFIQT